MGANGALPDAFLFARLEPLLDSGSRAVLKSELERNPGYTHAEFWREMDRTFVGEGPIASRQAWEEIPLASGGKLTPQSWRQFAADFKRLQHRVPDATDPEAVRLLRQRLPDRVAERVETEFCKRKSAAKLVSLQGIWGSHVEIAEWVRAVTGATPKTVVISGQNVKVDCTSDAQRLLMLNLNGRQLSNGANLHVAHLEYTLASEDVIQIVLEFLEQKQRCDDYRRPLRKIAMAQASPEVCLQGTPSSSSAVHEDNEYTMDIMAAAAKPSPGQTPSNRGSAPGSSQEGSRGCSSDQGQKKRWPFKKKSPFGQQNRQNWVPRQATPPPKPPPKPEAKPAAVAPPRAGGSQAQQK